MRRHDGLGVIVALVITSCTNRKRRPVAPDMRMGSLPKASLDGLAGAWQQRLANEKVLHPATDLYGGRSFQEARSVANELRATLLIVSAGLGLIEGASAVPAYGCTSTCSICSSVGHPIRSR